MVVVPVDVAAVQAVIVPLVAFVSRNVALQAVQSVADVHFPQFSSPAHAAIAVPLRKYPSAGVVQSVADVQAAQLSIHLVHPVAVGVWNPAVHSVHLPLLPVPQTAFPVTLPHPVNIVQVSAPEAGSL